MTVKTENQTATVTWHLVGKNLIKFEGHEESYKLADNVIAANDFSKYPLTKGSQVEYGLKDGVVTFLRKNNVSKPKSEEKVAEPIKETPKASEPDKKPPVSEEKPKSQPEPVKEQKGQETPSKRELTVSAVAGNKKVVKFLEINDSGWIQVSENIQAQDYKVIGLVAKNKVRVLIVDNTIVEIENTPQKNIQDVISEEPKKEEASYSNNKDQFYRIKQLENQVRFLENNKQDSIEAQSAVNAANELVGRISASLESKPPASKIIEMLEVISEANFLLIQKFKEKK